MVFKKFDLKNVIFKILNNKKLLKSIGLSLLQILIIAVFVIGAIIIAGKKLGINDNSNEIKGNDDSVEYVTNEDGETVEVDEDDETSSDYYIVVNKKKKVLIVYNTDKDGNKKDAIKAMRCSIGKDVPTGKFKLSDRYSWITVDGTYWNQYSCRYTESFWIQSVNYFAPYKSYMSVECYNKLGSYKYDGGGIQLTVENAKWIYDNCGKGTVVKIKKGDKTDKIPLQVDEITQLEAYVGWDPSDPDKDNPWSKVKKNSIASVDGTVYIERGSNVNYLSNVIAYDENNKDVTAWLEYSTFSTAQLGEYDIKYYYTKSNGKKLKAKVHYEVIDTLGPVVTFKSDDKEDFTYKVKTDDTEKINKKKVRNAIKKQVKELLSITDVDDVISPSTVTFTLPEELKVGENLIKMSVYDNYGNLTMFRTTITIEVDEDATEKTEKTTEETTTKKQETTTKKQQTTTKKQQTTTKKQQTTTKKQETTTKKKETTTKATETNTEPEVIELPTSEGVEDVEPSGEDY